MKKLYKLLGISLFLLTLCSISLSAANIDAAPKRISGRANLYIINLPDGGWAAYTTDPRARHTVLAYTTEGTFCYDSLPEPMQLWLQDYELQLSDTTGTAAMVAARRTPASAESTAAKVIAEISATNADRITPLIKSAWSQSAPYNNLCPELNGKTCVVGCVATAWSQISYFHKYPTSATFSYSYMWTKGAKTLSGKVNSTYDYSVMSNSVTTSSPVAAQTAVATLCHDWGLSSHMDYGESSGAVPVTACAGAIDNFGFDKTMLCYYHRRMDDDDWDAVLLSELQAGRPVLYSGWTKPGGGGHSFICDGYDGSGKFHFNYGWGSSAGYYCATTAMQSDYNYDQQIQTNILPAHGNAYNGMTACSTGDITGTVSLGKVTMAFADTLRIGVHHAGDFYYTICCENCSTGVKTYGTVITSNRVATGDRYLNYAPGKATVSLPATTTLAAGIYKCYPVYRTSTSQPWKKVYFRKAHKSNFKLTVSSTGTRTVGGVIADTIYFEKTSVTLYPGDTLTNAAELPVNTSSKSITYKSSNTDVATVASATGRVTARSTGTATITATTTDGSNLSASYTVTVKDRVVGSDFWSGNYHYTVIDITNPAVNLMGSKCPVTASIPETVTMGGITYKVTVIGGNAFMGCTDIKYLTIPASITAIASNAFNGCTNLIRITYKADSVANIGTGKNVFSKAGRDGNGIELIISDNVRYLPANLFYPSSNTTSRPNITLLDLRPKYPPRMGSNALYYIDDTVSVKYSCPESRYQYELVDAWKRYTNEDYVTYRGLDCSEMPPVPGPEPGPSTILSEKEQDKTSVRKFLRNGHLVIQVGDREYGVR